MMRRWLPFPLFSLCLWVIWLLLADQVSLGQCLLGALLAWLLPLLTRSFWLAPPRVKKPLALLRFLVMVGWDMLIANFQVARWVLLTPGRLQPAFLEVPLDLTDDFVITLLASTISLTPGTVSADVSEDRSKLLVHALNASDPDTLVAEIKARYETALKEVFGC